MRGFRFTQYFEQDAEGSPFERLLKLFKELLLHTSGDVAEALSWMTELDKQYKLTDENYGIADFIQELRDKGYIQGPEDQPAGMTPTAKMDRLIRQSSLEEIFGKMKRSPRGKHQTPLPGQGEELSSDIRPYQFGDGLDQIDFGQSIRNAHIQHGTEQFRMDPDDLVVRESDFQARTSTVLMIDVSHSMILYGEDRITPAKKVAMALAELITTRYPRDTLDVIAFGDDAWPIEISELPRLQVGPYHTNTVAGLQLAMDILRRRKNPNRQIFMITDGKPTCIKQSDGQYYKNSFGLDRRIINRTLNLGAQCRRLGIPVTTFMIAEDPWLQKFVEDFTQINRGKAFYTSLKGLGEYLFEDYEQNRRKRLR